MLKRFSLYEKKPSRTTTLLVQPSRLRVTHEGQLYRGLSSSQPNITVTLSFKLGRESHPLEHAGRGHERGGPSLAFLLQTSRDVYSIAEIRDLALAVAAFAHNHRSSMQRCGKLGDSTKLTLVERS